jgi:diguanylate cyclase (GGDEF)-like protein
VLLFILLVALLNLGLGFALAVYVAQCRAPAGDDDWTEQGGSYLDAVAPAVMPLYDASAAEPPAATAQEPDTENGLGLSQSDVDAVVSKAAETATAQPESQPAQSMESNPSHATVRTIQQEVQQYDAQLTELAATLRDPVAQASAEWFEERRQSLRTTNDEFLQSRNDAYEAFGSFHRNVESHQPICDALEETMLFQATKIQEANDTLEAYNFQGDVGDGCKRILAETNRLTDANHQVRDALEQAIIGIAREDQWLGSSSTEMRTDTMTGISNRVGLEISLAEWWNRDPHRVRQLSLALVDLDHFAKVNERHGTTLGDEILRAVARLLSVESREGSVVSRCAGQRFAILLPDTDIRAATNAMEKVRQILETSVFRHGETEIRLTLSCGVTESMPKDASESLLERAETAIREAKRYGRNRTFIHDGKFPTPVVPPNFTLQERQIEL